MQKPAGEQTRGVENDIPRAQMLDVDKLKELKERQIGLKLRGKPLPGIPQHQVAKTWT